QAREELRAPRGGDEADADEAGHERGGDRGDPDVARSREREAGAGGGSVDGGDHGLRQRADRADVRVVARLEVAADVAADVPELVQVLAGAEALARARDDDGPHGRGLRLL